MKFKAISSIILVIIFAYVLMMNGDVFLEENNGKISNEITDGDWYIKAIKNIEESEYFIKYDDNTSIFQSPNRNNDLRFYYYENGFSVEPRENENKWNIGIYLLSYGREDDSIKYLGGTIISNKNKALVENNDITIEYINNNSGMRENFIVHKKVEGNELLELNLRIDGDTEYEVGNNVILFKKDNKKAMEYKDLYVYDNNNKELKSEFIKTENGVKILVNDINAVYPITIDPLSTTVDWIGESNQASAWYGYSVSSAGDVNGDGYSDIIVGAPYYDNVESNEGAAFVYYGSSTGPSVASNWMMESNQTGAQYGISVSSAGDVNGDGYSDIIVGANQYDNVENNEGAAFVYYGSATGPSAVPNWTGESDQAFAFYGISVSSAGDVNGDGYSDIIVGANGYSNGEANEGAAYVYYGSSGGLSLTVDWMMESNLASAQYGISVASAGDVNGDGYSDIIIGAYGYDNGEADEGAAYVYFGGSTGPSATADWTREGNQVDAHYGFSVSSAGDVNGDGYSDIIIGAYGYDNGEADEGTAYVYFGGSTGPSVVPNWSGESNQAGACYGISVSSAGDVNGDGYSDIIVGAYRYDNGEADEGAAYVYSGGSTGPSTAADWTGESNQISACYGISVSSAGDVNGDGYSDIIVGAYRYDNGETNEGIASVYYGGSTGVNERKISMHNNNQLLDFNVYKDMQLLNEEIQEKELIIYTIDGRKLNKITSVGQYYIVKEMNAKIINKQKILIIY